MALLEKLVERLKSAEGLELEFKRGHGGIPKDLWPTVSAFSNTNGGWVILGVAEEGGARVLEGVPNADQRLKELNDLLRNPEKISHPVCGVDDVSVERLGGKEAVVLRVPAASRKHRPVYINRNPYTGTFVRRHSGDYQCQKQEVDRMMREASDVAIDSTILKELDLDALDPDAVGNHRARFRVANTGHPFNGYSDLRFLEAVDVTRKSGLTVAGLLLLGTEQAIRRWRGRHLIDYRLLGENRERSRWDDRLAWEGNLLLGFEAIYTRLTADVPTPFRLRGGTRVDEGPVHVAVREALVNLLVHADYSETGSSVILRSAEGYSFRNPGSSRVAERDLFKGDRSDPRNPTLVRLFRLIGLAEEAGSGIPQIIQMWRRLGLETPRIETGTERYEFVLELRYAHLIPSETREWLAALGPKWSEEEQLALVSALNDGRVDNETLRNLAGIHASDATKALVGLRDRGFLDKYGSRRGAYYQLSEKARPGNLEQLDLVDVRPGAAAHVPGHASSVSSAPNLRNKQKKAEERTDDLSRVARRAREHQRLPPGQLKAIIARLCTIQPQSIWELVELVQRSHARVSTLVGELVDAEMLFPEYPNRPTHPNQRYHGKRRRDDSLPS